MDYYCPFAPGGICENYDPDLCEFCPYDPVQIFPEYLLKQSEVDVDDESAE